MPYRGCGFGSCDDSIDNDGPGCDLCDRVAKLPQAPSGIDRLLRRQANAARSGVAKTKRNDPTFLPRPRVGPHR